MIEPRAVLKDDIWMLTDKRPVSIVSIWWRHHAADTLTHWGRVTHICVSKLTIIGSDNGLSPGRRQAIIWTNAGIFSIGPLGTNFNETSIEIHTSSFKKIQLKISSAKWRSFCLGLNVLKTIHVISYVDDIVVLAIVSPGGRFKNTYELLNLRALKFSPVNKIHIFQCMGKIFCVEFQRYPLKFHTKYLTHTLKDMIFIQHWHFKSS